MDCSKTFGSALFKQLGKLTFVVLFAISTYYASVPMMTTWWGATSFSSLLLNWIMFPSTIVLSILYTFNLVKDTEVSPGQKILILCIIFTLLVVVCVLSHRTGTIFDCNILGCTVNSVEAPQNDQYDAVTNQKEWSTDSMMLMFFFTSLATIPIVLWQLVRFCFIAMNKAVEEVTIDQKDLMNPMISKVDASDTSTTAAKYKSYYDAVCTRKNKMRFLAAFFGFNILIPVHIILTSRLGNNFQWVSSHYIAQYGQKTVNNPGEYDDDFGYGPNVELSWKDSNNPWPVYHQQYIGYVPQVRVSDDVVLKLFPDVGMFYLYIYLICFVGLLAQFSPSVKTFLGTRRPIFLGYSQGEVLLVSSFGLFLVLFFSYWYYVHAYEGYYKENFTVSEKWGRTMGVMSLTVMGFMLLPVSRNSIFSTVFNMSWEAMIKFHRWMGNIFLGFALSHVFSFMIVFAEQDMFPGAMLRVSSVTDKLLHDDINKKATIPDNYTVPAMTVIFFIIIIPSFLFATHDYIRRNYFEVFYYTHFTSMILIMGTLWHAASAWYYLLPALTLWLVDHAIRFSKASEDAEVVSFNAKKSKEESFTEIKFVVKPTALNGWFGHGKSRDGPLKGLDYQTGQYLFINIPKVSLLEVHPFTISSSPLDPFTSLHIKGMGPNTWTGKLNDLVSDMQSQKKSPESLQINVDGPYGVPFEYKQHSQILLVCGGIGVTPCISILRTLLLLHGKEKALSVDPECKVASVKFLWSCRSEDLIKTYEDTFRRIIALNKDTVTQSAGSRDVKFKFALHNSVKKPGNEETTEESGEESVPILTGRPKIEDEIKKMAGDPDAIVFVCGPDAMVNDCAKFTMQYGVQYHTETFLL